MLQVEHNVQGADAVIFALAPILLLLSQDPLLLWGLHERRRYFPLAAAISGCLAWSIATQLATMVPHCSIIFDLGEAKIRRCEQQRRSKTDIQEQQSGNTS